jgi:hypothetical protein
MILEPADDFSENRAAYGGISIPPSGEPENKPPIIEDVSPGRYWVRVDSGYGYVASIKCEQMDLLRHPLVVPAVGLTGPIELTLRDDGAQIDGIVDNISRTPGSPLSQSALPAAYIYFIPSRDSAGQLREVWASPEGTFSEAEIPPGDYKVLAFDRPQLTLEYTNEAAMRKYESEEQEIRLLPGQDAHLQVHMISRSE